MKQIYHVTISYKLMHATSFFLSFIKQYSQEWMKIISITLAIVFKAKEVAKQGFSNI